MKKGIPKIIVILGPTSSGKSALAVQIADFVNKKNKNYKGAEIISADSRQVYRGLNIGSGKITKKEANGIKHHLINIASPKSQFSAEKFKKSGQKIISNLDKKNILPIICGGTGMYIDSLIYDLDFPKIKPNPKLRKELESKSIDELAKILKKLDPKRYREIDKKNPRRLIRAIEIIKATGKPIKKIKKKRPYNVLKIGISIEKKDLEKKIAARMSQMIKRGLIKETKNLKEKYHLSNKKISSLGFEYKIPLEYILGNIKKDELVSRLINENFKYVKRQLTWWKKDEEIIWISDKQKALALAKDFLVDSIY